MWLEAATESWLGWRCSSTASRPSKPPGCRSRCFGRETALCMEGGSVLGLVLSVPCRTGSPDRCEVPRVQRAGPLSGTQGRGQVQVARRVKCVVLTCGVIAIGLLMAGSASANFPGANEAADARLAHGGKYDRWLRRSRADGGPELLPVAARHRAVRAGRHLDLRTNPAAHPPGGYPRVPETAREDCPGRLARRWRSLLAQGNTAPRSRWNCFA